MACSFIPSQGCFLTDKCHCNISQNTNAHEKASTLWLYFGCAVQSSGACQFTVPTRLLTMDRVDCLTLASPKSAILAVPRAVIRILDDLQSLWMMDGFRVCKYSRPRAISSIMLSCGEVERSVTEYKKKINLQLYAKKVY